MIRTASKLLALSRNRLANVSNFARAFTASAPSLTNLNVRPDGVAVIEMSR